MSDSNWRKLRNSGEIFEASPDPRADSLHRIYSRSVGPGGHVAISAMA
jgi:hypothetical protein